jgi:hypothetical protein
LVCDLGLTITEKRGRSHVREMGGVRLSLDGRVGPMFPFMQKNVTLIELWAFY